MNQERFDYLLQRFKTDTLTESESREWNALVESELYQSALEADIEVQLTQGPGDPRWDATRKAAAWQNILAALGKPASASSPTSEPASISVSNPASASTSVSRRTMPVRWLWAAAACVLIAFGLWWYVRPGRGLQTQELIARAPRGGKTHVILSDGTSVWLNAVSSLYYPAAFADGDRRVRLEGQAYFEVTANSHSLFSVITHGLTVDVLGTRFDISDYPGNGEARAVLLEGAVRVRGQNDSLMLRPGQEAVRNSGASALILRPADTTGITAWKNNFFYFGSTPLSDVSKELERWFDVQIVIDKTADTVRVTGSVSRRRPLKEVLDMLAFTTGIHYSMEGKTIQLKMGKK